MPRSLTRDLVTLLLAGTVAIIGLTGWMTFRIWQVGQQDERATSVDAVVVMGAAQYDGRPSPVFEARLDHAIELVRSGVAPRLIVTGGRQPGDRFSEAEAARRYAIDRGVPGELILAETSGTDTRSSLVNVAALLDSEGLERAIFVSDRTHMLRVRLLARDLGITGFGSPTASSPIDRDLAARAAATIREIAALAAYLAGR